MKLIFEDTVGYNIYLFFELKIYFMFDSGSYKAKTLI